MPNKEKVLKGLEWILEDDRFGFGQGLTQPESEEEQAGVYIRQAIDYLNPPVTICSNCGLEHLSSDRKCPKCGKEQVW